MVDRRRLHEEEAKVATLARGALPALITGGAGDDPAGVLTYTMVGASTGLSQLWLLVLSTPMLAAANSMAARIALAANDGLAAVIEERYGRAVSFLIVLLLAVANVATIAADTAGVAAVLEMLTGVRWEVFVPFILLILVLILHKGYAQVKKILTVLTAVLLTYVVAAVAARPDWGVVVLATLLPRVVAQRAWLIAALGLLGTTISPYLLFWQAGEEVEELHQGITVQAAHEDVDVWVGMIYSNLIAFFIIVAAAATIHAGGGQIADVADAARALAPLGRLGEAAFIVGLLGAGLLALPVLAGSTAYAVAELFGWPEGLGAQAAHARGFYIVLAGSLVGGALISLWPNFRPAEALFYSQVLDGVLLPILILMLLVLSNDRRIVGAARNPRWVNWMAVLTILVALATDFVALLGG
jgi:Mn2+/Fe2+ NRAMP family transporter